MEHKVSEGRRKACAESTSLTECVCGEAFVEVSCILLEQVLQLVSKTHIQESGVLLHECK